MNKHKLIINLIVQYNYVHTYKYIYNSFKLVHKLRIKDEINVIGLII